MCLFKLERVVQILNEEAGILLDEARHSQASCGTNDGIFIQYTSCTNSFQRLTSITANDLISSIQFHCILHLNHQISCFFFVVYSIVDQEFDDIIISLSNMFPVVGVSPLRHMVNVAKWVKSWVPTLVTANVQE